jgi:SAM-dependent methyltransferase
MELTTTQRLADLNRTFYEQHAQNFAETRPRLAPGVQRLLEHIPANARVLELGCGDGKVGRWLAGHRNVAAYRGLDSSPAMLDRARRLSEAWNTERAGPLAPSSTFHAPLSFALADLASPDWLHLLPLDAFDWILAFALFHHLPGFENRARVLREAAARLEPGGEFVMSNWQFTRSERLRAHVVPWAGLGLSEADVEPNDYLLSWERKEQRGLRYVHVLTEAEARQMAKTAGLTVVEVFQSDGVTGDLAEYVRMGKSGYI